MLSESIQIGGRAPAWGTSLHIHMKVAELQNTRVLREPKNMESITLVRTELCEIGMADKVIEGFTILREVAVKSGRHIHVELRAVDRITITDIIEAVDHIPKSLRDCSDSPLPTVSVSLHPRCQNLIEEVVN
jgi:hypothetical protein